MPRVWYTLEPELLVHKEAWAERIILAIDLGKFNSICCWYDTATKEATLRRGRRPGHRVALVERNFSNEADVVLTKAGPGVA